MSTKRVACYYSDVYHRPNCHYVKRMRPENRLSVTKMEAIEHGCCACRYCNSMNYFVNIEQEVIDRYKTNVGMDFLYSKGTLFVKTDLSCWKLVYSRQLEKIILFHINNMPENFDFTHPWTCSFHRQEDVPVSNSISKYLSYINEHDKYKAAVKSGQQIISFSSKKSRNLAIRSEKKSARR